MKAASTARTSSHVPLGRQKQQQQEQHRQHQHQPLTPSGKTSSGETPPRQRVAAATAASPLSPSLSQSPNNSSLHLPPLYQQQQQQSPTTAAVPAQQQQQSPMSATSLPPPPPQLSFSERLSQLSVSGVSSKEHKHAIVYPHTRIPPRLFLYKQNAASSSFAPSQLLVSTSIDTSTVGEAAGGDSTMPQNNNNNNNRKRWLPSETPVTFDRMEMRYLAQVLDKLVGAGGGNNNTEIADACIPLDRAKAIVSSPDADAKEEAVLEQEDSSPVLVPPAPDASNNNAKDPLRLVQRAEGLLIGLHEIARLTAPASQDLTALSTHAVDQVRHTIYQLLHHVQYHKQSAKREKQLRHTLQRVIDKQKADMEELTAEVAKLSVRMTQYYETKPEYVENRKTAPTKLMLPGAPTVEDLTHKERKAYDTYVPAQNKSLQRTFVDSVLTTATPGVKSVTNFGREEENDGNDNDNNNNGDDDGGSSGGTFAAQSQAILTSSERACRLPPGVSKNIRRRHPPITKDVGVDCTDLYYFGHAQISGPQPPTTPTPTGGAVSGSNVLESGSSSNSLETLRRKASSFSIGSGGVASPSQLNLINFRRSNPDAADDPYSLYQQQHDNLFNFSLPAPKLYVHEGALFVQPVCRLFQGPNSLQSKDSMVLGTKMQSFAGNVAVQQQQQDNTLVAAADLVPAAVELAPGCVPSPRKEEGTQKRKKKMRSDDDDDDDDDDATASLRPEASGGFRSSSNNNNNKPTSPAGKRSGSRRPRPPKKRGGGGAAAAAGDHASSKLSDSPKSPMLSPSASVSLEPQDTRQFTSDGEYDDEKQQQQQQQQQLLSPPNAAATGVSLSSNSNNGGSSNNLRLPGSSNFRRVGNTVMSLLRKRANQGAALNQVSVETQTDKWPPPGTDVEVQTGPVRDMFGMRVGGGGGSPRGAGNSTRSNSKKNKSSSSSSRPTNTSSGAASRTVTAGGGAASASAELNDTFSGTSAQDIGNVLAGFQDELGISKTGAAGSSSSTTTRSGGALDASKNNNNNNNDAGISGDHLLDATSSHHNTELVYDAIINTDVTLCGPQLHRMLFLDAIVACNVRHFDGVVAHKHVPNMSSVPPEMHELLDRRFRSHNLALWNDKRTNGRRKKARKQGGDDDDDVQQEVEEEEEEEEDEEQDDGGEKRSNKKSAATSSPAATAAALSALSQSFVGFNNANSNTSMFNALSDAALSMGNRARSSSVMSANGGGGGGGGSPATSPTSAAAGAGGRKQQRYMHSHTILYSKSLPPIWRAELGQRPNFSGARIKARDWTNCVVMELFRSIDVLLVCPTRPFAVNVIEFVYSKFGGGAGSNGLLAGGVTKHTNKQARPYLLDILVNAKVQSLSAMRCYVFVQLAELAGFAGIDSILPQLASCPSSPSTAVAPSIDTANAAEEGADTRATAPFLYYYLFVTQRLQRTMSFRGIREFAHGTLVLNREAVVALLDAHLVHIAASYSEAAEWEADRRTYYAALLSLRRLTADELGIVRFMQQLPCIVEGTHCDDPAPLVAKAAEAIMPDTELWKRLESLDTLVPLHADVVVYLVCRNHDSLVELIVERAKRLYSELEARRAYRPSLVSNKKGEAFEANVTPPPPMIALQLLPVSLPTAVGVHPLIRNMGTGH